ncbi:sulfite exporter TauE/SafE family protein [Pseudomonas aeruginosa]
MLIGALLGVLIGALLGLTGAGGGILAVPALVFGLGMAMRQAAPVALIAVGAAAAVGALQGLRQGIVRYKAAAVLAASGVVASPLGIRLAHHLPDTWIAAIFAAVMVIVAHRMFRSSQGHASEPGATAPPGKACQVSAETGRFVWTSRMFLTLVAIGAVSGVSTGMLGVGGGFIIVPALTYFSELRVHSIVATSLMVIALISAATVSMAWAQGFTMTQGAWAFSLAAVGGMGIGRLVAPRIPARELQRGFALTCVLVAALMVVRNFS